MAKRFPHLEPEHREFIHRQRLFFTASASAVLGESAVVYLDRTGSGNETAAHLRADGRLTLMFCAFEGPPRILRLYGRGRVIRQGSPEYTQLLAAEFNNEEPPGARQMVWLDIELVQTSCRLRRAAVRVRRRTSHPHEVGRGEGPGDLSAREERVQHRWPAHRTLRRRRRAPFTLTSGKGTTPQARSTRMRAGRPLRLNSSSWPVSPSGPTRMSEASVSRAISSRPSSVTRFTRASPSTVSRMRSE